MKITQFNNGIYYGQLDYNFKKIGLGVFIYDDSTVYYGQWKNDVYNGEGQLLFPYCTIMKGTFKNHSLEGIAISITNNEILIGEYQNSILINKALIFDGKKWKVRILKNGQHNDFDCQPNSEQHLFSEFVKHFPTLYKSKLLLTLVGFTISDQEIQIGEFKNNKLDGIGRILDFSQKIIEDGYYKNGVLQKGLRYYVENNSFEQVQLVFEKGDFDYKVCFSGTDFPQNLINKQRLQIHQTSKNYISKSQEIPFFHSRFLNQFKPLMKITLNQFILEEDVSNEGETHKPEEKVRRASFHNENNRKLELEQYKIELQNVLKPVNKKRIFDKFNF